MAKNVQSIFNNLFSMRKSLEDLISTANSVATEANDFGGEISRVLGEQMKKYFIPSIEGLIQDKSIPGNLSGCIEFLDSVPLAMTRMEPDATPSSPVVPSNVELSIPNGSSDTGASVNEIDEIPTGASYNNPQGNEPVVESKKRNGAKILKEDKSPDRVYNQFEVTYKYSFEELPEEEKGERTTHVAANTKEDAKRVATRMLGEADIISIKPVDFKKPFTEVEVQEDNCDKDIPVEEDAEENIKELVGQKKESLERKSLKEGFRGKYERRVGIDPQEIGEDILSHFDYLEDADEEERQYLDNIISRIEKVLESGKNYFTTGDGSDNNPHFIEVNSDVFKFGAIATANSKSLKKEDKDFISTSEPSGMYGGWLQFDLTFLDSVYDIEDAEERCSEFLRVLEQVVKACKDYPFYDDEAEETYYQMENEAIEEEAEYLSKRHNVSVEDCESWLRDNSYLQDFGLDYSESSFERDFGEDEDLEESEKFSNRGSAFRERELRLRKKLKEEMVKYTVIRTSNHPTTESEDLLNIKDSVVAEFDDKESADVRCEDLNTTVSPEEKEVFGTEYKVVKKPIIGEDGKIEEKKLKEGPGAGYEIKIKDLELDLDSLEVIEDEDDYVEFGVDVKRGNYEFSTNHSYWGSEGEAEIEGTLYGYYEGDDHSRGNIQGELPLRATLETWYGSGYSTSFPEEEFELGDEKKLYSIGEHWDITFAFFKGHSEDLGLKIEDGYNEWVDPEEDYEDDPELEDDLEGIRGESL